MTKTFTLTTLALASLILAPSAAFADEKSYDLAPAHAIDVGGSGTLIVEVGGEQSIVILASPKDLEKLELRVDNGTLKIRQKKGRGWFSNGPDYEARITLKSLDSLDLSGAVEAKVKGINANTFNYDASGASETVLEGTCKSMDVDVSGATELNAKNFICEDVNVDASGATELAIHATGNISIGASGATEIDIYGEPVTRRMSTSGASDVNYHKN